MLKWKTLCAPIIPQTHMQRMTTVSGFTPPFTLSYWSSLKGLPSNSWNYWQNLFQKFTDRLQNIFKNWTKNLISGLQAFLTIYQSFKRGSKRTTAMGIRVPKRFKIISVQRQFWILTSLWQQWKITA